MASDFKFDEGKPAAPARSSGNSCLMTCLVVFGILFAVVLIAGGIGAWYLSRNWKSLAAGLAEQAVSQVIEQSDALEPEQKQALKAEVARMSNAFQEGRISEEKLGQFFEDLAKSSLMSSFIVQAIEARYLEKSGLDDEEKQTGRRTLRRFLRGWSEDQLDKSDFDDVMQYVADKKEDGSWDLRQTLTDDELRKFLAATKQKADEAGVPDEDFAVDPVEEFRRLVDEALGESTASEPPAAEAPDEASSGDSSAADQSAEAEAGAEAR